MQDNRDSPHLAGAVTLPLQRGLALVRDQTLPLRAAANRSDLIFKLEKVGN